MRSGPLLLVMFLLSACAHPVPTREPIEEDEPLPAFKHLSHIQHEDREPHATRTRLELFVRIYGLDHKLSREPLELTPWLLYEAHPFLEHRRAHRPSIRMLEELRKHVLPIPLDAIRVPLGRCGWGHHAWVVQLTLGESLPLTELAVTCDETRVSGWVLRQPWPSRPEDRWMLEHTR